MAATVDGPAAAAAARSAATGTARLFDTAVYAYPWDIVGDEAAPALLAGLGAGHVSLAAVYHATRALTPRHPGHRVVVAEHTAAYFPLDAACWRGPGLRPPPQTWLRDADPFATAARALAAHALPVHAWVVVCHVDPRLATDLPATVVNAYGDRYTWALCPARDEVREYAARLAAQAACRGDAAGVEFEACGWYGFDHQHTHDKIASVPFDDAGRFLLSLCFCDACLREYRREGINPKHLREITRAALDATFSRGAPTRAPRAAAAAPASPAAPLPPPGPGGTATVAEIALGPELGPAVLALRGKVADRLRADVVQAVRAERPRAQFPILFHGNPRTHRSTAFTGLDPATLPPQADGVVVNCWGSPADAAHTVALAATGAQPGARVVAGMLAVAGMGASAERLLEVSGAVRAAGASGVRLYHAGLASAADLVRIGDLLAALH